ncbi:hypothetical protein M9458_022419, partial [Cirrhinus mrigala]
QHFPYGGLLSGMFGLLALNSNTMDDSGKINRGGAETAEPPEMVMPAPDSTDAVAEAAETPEVVQFTSALV